MAVKLQPLPFSLGALEPHVSAATLELHHGQHEAGYVERVNRLIADTPLANASLDHIVATARDSDNRALYNNAAQAWNHAFYWSSLSPRGGGQPHGAIAHLIERDFGRHELFTQRLQQVAVSQFGSGWAWVTLRAGRLEIVSTGNADLPSEGRVPLLVIDVWEHAYYLDHQHRRGTYVSGVIDHLLNWEFANERIDAADARLRSATGSAARSAL
jgi:Fe-Mn family superoxide dismutase